MNDFSKLLSGGPDAQKIREDLLDVFLKQPFPIRGWHITIDRSMAYDRVNFPLYKWEPEKNSEGVMVREPDSEEIIPGVHHKMTARFKLVGQTIVLNGRERQIPPNAIDRQFLQFYIPKKGILIQFDPKAIRSYEAECFGPDQDAWKLVVEKWVTKKKRARVHQEAKYSMFMLGQLAKIRENFYHMLHQTLGSLVNQINNGEPDYWTHIEYLLNGKMVVDVIEKQEAIKIILDERYAQAAKETTNQVN